MLLDGASGLLVVLGISVILNIVIFMYFRNKTTAMENKMDVMFTIIQEHATQSNNQQSSRPQDSVDLPDELRETSQQAASAPDLQNEKITVSDNESDGITDSDDDDDDSDSVSDNDENNNNNVDLNKTILLNDALPIVETVESVIPIESVETVENNEILSNGEILETTKQALNDDDDNDDDDDESDGISDSDDEDGDGESSPIVIDNDANVKTVDIDNLVEEIPNNSTSNNSVLESFNNEVSGVDLKKYTVTQLRELAASNGHTGVSKMKKQELMKLLNQ